MRAKVFFIVCVTAMGVRASETVLDSVALPDVEVSVSRTEAVVSREASAVTVADMRLVETARVVTPKDVAALAPKLKHFSADSLVYFEEDYKKRVFRFGKQ